ncbi:MAG: ABC transporter permease [Rhodospirillaceae bacterium]|nr:ABC transporter permease [Rhodospirillaceae bacterium]
MGFYFIQFLTGLASASSLFLIAAGMSIIFGVTRILNFAHGSLYMLGAYISYWLVTTLTPGPLGFWLAVLAAATVVGLVGIVIETGLLRRIYQAPELFQLIATFGVILIISDITRFIWGETDLVGPRAPGLDGAIEIFGHSLPEYDIAMIVLGPLVLGIIWLIFHRTRWGTLVRAATQDREMVGALGVNQAFLFTSVFFLGAFLAGLGGAAQIPKGGADLLMDLNVIAEAFVIVVIGGMGSILGAFLAAVIIGELNAFGILVFPQMTLVLMFAVMAIVLLVRPWGLLGRPEAVSRAPGEAPEPPLQRADKAVRCLFTATILLLLLVPLFSSDFILVILIDIFIFVLFAVSLHFIMGPGGLVSFGHAAYYGLGAYGTALLVHYLGTPMEFALIAAPIIAAIGALVFGWFSVRLSGVYFAMLTLAFAQITWSVVFQWNDFTYGDDGILNIWPSAWLSSKTAYYYFALILSLVCVYILRRTLFTPFGYITRAGRDSPLRADAIGINVQRQQWLAFIFAGAFAGLAGSIYVFSKGSVFPDQVAIPQSIDGLMMVLLGGVKTLTGPIVGAAAFTALTDWLSSNEVWFWRSILGAIILALVILFPQGIVGFVRDKFRPPEERG